MGRLSSQLHLPLLNGLGLVAEGEHLQLHLSLLRVACNQAGVASDELNELRIGCQGGGSAWPEIGMVFIGRSMAGVERVAYVCRLL